jgi:hypothetical protein
MSSYVSAMKRLLLVGELLASTSRSTTTSSQSLLLPAPNWSTVPVASWCGNASGPLTPSAAAEFAARPLAVFEKDMAQDAAPRGRGAELKIATAAAQVRAASRVQRPAGPTTQVLMYFTVGSLLPQYTTSRYFTARPELMLHDDAGHLVTVNYSLSCPSHRAGCQDVPVAVPWVDFSQDAAVDGWVDSLYAWVSNGSVDGIALDGNPYDDEWIVSVGGSPGILANVSSVSKRRAFIRGLDDAEQRLGALIASSGGILMANGVHKPGDNGMLFEEFCGEHSYLRREHGCDGVESPIACDMLILQRYAGGNSSRVTLCHTPDAGVVRTAAVASDASAASADDGASSSPFSASSSVTLSAVSVACHVQGRRSPGPVRSHGAITQPRARGPGDFGHGGRRRGW